MAPNRFDFNTALHQCAQGNQAALQRIYEHEAPQMMAYALSLLGSPSEAEELIRESFILSWKNALGFDASLGDGRAWLYSIFRYRAQARLHQKGAHSDITLQPPTLSLNSPNPTAFLRSASRLDSVSRLIVLMAYLQGDNYQNIAQRLAIPINQVRMRSRAALGQLHAVVTGWANPNLGEQQLLIAEYTLGLLSGVEQQQTRNTLQHDDHAAQDALLWELHLLTFCDALRAARPSNQLLWRIQTALGHETNGATAPTSNTELNAAHNNTSFIPQFVRADSASSLSIPQRIESKPSVTTAHLKTDLNDQNPAPQHKAEAPTEPTKKTEASPATEKTDASVLKTKAPLVNGLARFLPKKNETTPVKPKAEPSLNNTTDSNTVSTTPAVSAPVVDKTFSTASASSDQPQAKVDTKGSDTHITADESTSNNKQSNLWRNIALSFAVIAIGLGIKILLSPAEPSISVIEMAPRQAAVLQAPGQSSTPGWILTVDPEGNVLLNPQVETQISESQSAQLWTQQASSSMPKSLGLIDPNRPVTLPHALIGSLETGQIFEITLEAKGGANSATPSGPVLFIGRLVRFGDSPSPIQPVISEHS